MPQPKERDVTDVIGVTTAANIATRLTSACVAGRRAMKRAQSKPTIPSNVDCQTTSAAIRGHPSDGSKLRTWFTAKLLFSLFDEPSQLV
jgi:hypothetical protein